MPQKFDFSGWATKNDIKCSDGRTIRRDAFKDQDGLIVPLVWNHMHNEPDNVLGHALLQNRPEGVYAYGKFNDTESGQNAKLLVNHGDIVSLSIYANHLKQNGGDVIHGSIREVSLVLAGANPGAQIDNIITHGEGDEDSAVIAFIGRDFSDSFEHTLEFEEEIEEEKEGAAEEVKVEEPASEELEELEHKDNEKDADEGTEAKEEKEGAKEMADEKNKTVQDVIDTMTEEQKTVMYALIGQALEDAKANKEDDEDEEMKHNVFDSETNKNVLTHSDMDEIMKNAKRIGSLKDAYEGYVQENFIQHADDDEDDPYANVDYGMEHIDVLFPDAQLVGDRPQVVKREDSWVSKFLNGARHTPFSRVKSVYADLTEDDARAKGYIKGTQKKNEVFPLFKRVTTPTTVYKKQQLDRDDVLDLTFDIVPWLKAEMRGMLNEELARAALLGDGRDPSSDEKISESNIRPIYKDTTNDVYAIKVAVDAKEDEEKDAKAFIKAAIKARADFRGTGKPTLYCTTALMTNMLLLEDNMGRRLYATEAELATALRVAEIVEVPVMDAVSREEGGFTYELEGIIVNPKDYTFGADKGGEVSMFDDFDIDFNQQKYLIETRCSGALTTPKSALVIERKATSEVSA